MRIFEVVIIVRTENVCRDRRSEVATKLFVVSAVFTINRISSRNPKKTGAERGRKSILVVDVY